MAFIRQAGFIPPFIALAIFSLLSCGSPVSDSPSPSPKPPNTPDQPDPTPDENLDCEWNFAPELYFSKASGFYEQPFQLELLSTCPATIRYTLDGSEPTLDSQLYQQAIEISESKTKSDGISYLPTNRNDSAWYGWKEPEDGVFSGTVIRARAWDSEGNPGPVVTGNWLIGENLLERYPLPVVHLTADANDLFDEALGIFVPGVNYVEGDEWSGNYYAFQGQEAERPIHLEFLKNGAPTLQFDAGIRVHGNFSRQHPQKSLRIYLRKEYGLSQLEYPLFPGENPQSFHRLLLRNAGNDWGQVHMKDVVGQSLLRNLRLTQQRHQPVIVFLNGEYWGIQYLRDRLDKNHLASHYGLDTNDAVIIENHNGVSEGTPEDLDAYKAFANRLDSLTDNLPKLAAELQENVDLEDLFDYYSVQIYLRNQDWPHNNTQVWRKRTPPTLGTAYGHDGRWRWTVFDLDLSQSYSDDDDFEDTLAHALSPHVHWATKTFRHALSVPEFQQRFALRFADHINTTFTPKRYKSRIADAAQAIEAPLVEHRKRWLRPHTMSDWRNKVEALKIFAELRPNLVRQHLSTHFGLGNWNEVELSQEGDGSGILRLNDHLTIHETSSMPWKGEYPSALPIQIRAHPAKGSCFAGWVGSNSPHSSLKITPTGPVVLKAKFMKSGSGQCLPALHHLKIENYELKHWSDLEPAGISAPASTILMAKASEPRLGDEMECEYTGDFNSDSRSRVNGLGDYGLAFINTGNSDYCGKLGAFEISLNTEGVTNIQVEFTAGTLEPNTRSYAWRLQYGMDEAGPFTDVVDEDNTPVEYQAQSKGNKQRFENILLPPEAEDQPHLRLRWIYHFIGSDEDKGARSHLRLGDIRIHGDPA